MERENRMKRLHVFIEREEVTTDLKKRIPEICVHMLPEQFWITGINKEELADLGLSDWKESLYVTDNPTFASLLSGRDYPVLAYIHDGNRDKSFTNVKYVIEGFEDVDKEYFVRVWQRLVGKPWHMLDTERCSIRETTVEDLEAFYELYSAPAITKYMENLFTDRDEERVYIETYAKTVYEFYGYGMWTVMLKETDEVIGRAGISMREGFEDPELGFMIGEPWQGKGLATEVCGKILEYAAKELGFIRVIAFVQPGNQQSIGLLQKLGFAYEENVIIKDVQYLLFGINM